MSESRQLSAARCDAAAAHELVDARRAAATARPAERSGAPIGAPGPLGRLLVRGEYGHDLIDELQPQVGEPVIDKPGYCAFAATDLELILRTRGIDSLIITGVTTEVCVSSTLRSAIDRGFNCLTVSDACASAHPELHAAALAMI